MSIEAIRSAFMAAGKGVVRLTHAGLAYKDSRQVLTCAGWHADGTKTGTNRDCRLEGSSHISSYQSQRRECADPACPLPARAESICWMRVLPGVTQPGHSRDVRS
jgi:hypothetical protein